MNVSIIITASILSILISIIGVCKNFHIIHLFNLKFKILVYLKKKIQLAVPFFTKYIITWMYDPTAKDN